MVVALASLPGVLGGRAGLVPLGRGLEKGAAWRLLAGRDPCRLIFRSLIRSSRVATTWDSLLMLIASARGVGFDHCALRIEETTSAFPSFGSH